MDRLARGQLYSDHGRRDHNSQNVPHYYLLLQNHPNPFNPTTSIRFQIPVAAKVEIAIYDLLGQSVRTLVSQDFSAGVHSVKWNGDAENGKVSAGVYMCVMKSGDYTANKKIIFLK